MPAKYGHQWTECELLTFNVSTTSADINTFFGVKELPAIQISPWFLSDEMKPKPLSGLNKDRFFFDYLFCALTEDKAAVNNFAQFILRLLDYDSEDRIIRSRMVLNFTMCGKTVRAKPDISVISEDREGRKEGRKEVYYMAWSKI
ncbi:hypothetical protein BT96DRAFT_1031658 [Gymnopus androsaceus JB14]|uniref:Uncharacterized protein n=1 Tax=Gymnopus androsaceus JB14 TaxID=1447944 RepID=A0A6A4GDI6_9AGAR|nr:hypothetical protein BT96DRAFT_1031658 [Gymnopus androsaceus JB14]